MPICVVHAQLIRIEATLGGCVPVGRMYAPAGGMDSMPKRIAASSTLARWNC